MEAQEEKANISSLVSDFEYKNLTESVRHMKRSCLDNKLGKDCLKLQNDYLKKEVDKLNNALETCQAENRQIQEKVCDYKEDNKLAKEALIRQNKYLKKQVDKMIQVAEQCQARSKNIWKNACKWRGKIRTLETSLNQAKIQISAGKTKTSHLKSRLKTTQATLASKEEEIDQLQSSKSQMEEQNKTLITENRKITAVSQKQQGDIEKLSRLLATSELEGKKLTETVKYLKNSYLDSSSAQASLTQSNRDLEKKVEELKHITETRVAESEQIRKEACDWRVRFETSEKSLEEVKVKLTARKTETSHLKSKLKTTEATLASKEEEIDQLQSLKSQMEEQNRTLITENTTITAVLQKQQNDVEKLSHLLATSESESKKLMQTVQCLKNSCFSLTERNQDLENEIYKLKSVIEARVAECEQMQEEALVRKARLEASEKSLEEVKVKLSDATTEACHLEARLKSKKTTVAFKKAEVSQLKLVNCQIDELNKALITENTRLTAVSQKQQNDIEKLSHLLATSELEAKKRMETVQCLRNNYLDSSLAQASPAQSNQDLKKEVEKLKSIIEARVAESEEIQEEACNWRLD
ncbi:hypothetical protein WMY93_013225 [Mugilogobius chulae]|uniref:Uncharacterized protein n=1 Tax=Mugilogobius chulae TaxID=88201 RepID=A0AAW0PAV4_9GOBI